MRHAIGRNPAQFLTLIVGLGAIGSCTPNESPVAARELPALTQIVAGEAARRLGANGQFILSGPISSPYAQIDALQATALGDAFLSKSLRGFLSYLEAQRGGGVNPLELKQCGRVYYAEPAIEALPPSAHPAIRRAFGPHWIINYCGQSGVAELALAVSAYATDLKIQDGQLVYPAIDGGEYFHPVGIPVQRGASLPESPEQAAAEAASITGSSVLSVPRLVTPPGMYPIPSFWRVEIARPQTVRGRLSKATTTTSVFYVTDDPRWGHKGRWISKIGEPDHFDFSSPVSAKASGSAANFVKGTVRVRDGLAVKIEPVEESSR